MFNITTLSQLASVSALQAIGYVQEYLGLSFSQASGIVSGLQAYLLL